MTVHHEDGGHPWGTSPRPWKEQKTQKEGITLAHAGDDGDAESLSSPPVPPGPPCGDHGKHRPDPALRGRGDDVDVVHDPSVTSGVVVPEVDESGAGASTSDELGHEAEKSPSSRSPESTPSKVVMAGAGSPTVNARHRRKAPRMGTARSPRPSAPPDAGQVINGRKARSVEHENRVARVLGGQRVVASGALGHPGDVRTKTLLVSAKSTGLREYRLDLSDVERIAAEADAEGLTPAMALDFAAVVPGVERDWVLIPLRVVVGLLRRPNSSETQASFTEPRRGP